MRILYGVVGEGMGHATRSRVVIEHLLDRGHDIRVVVSGRAHRFLTERFANRPHITLQEIHGLHMDYADNRFRIGSSVWTNMTQAPGGILQNVAAYQRIAEDGFRPEMVVSDFESWAYLYGLNHRLPVVDIDNQQVINRCRHDPSLLAGKRLDYLMTRIAVKAKLPWAYHYLVTSFFFPPVRKKRTTLVPPILRPEILAARREPGKHVLVYQTSAANTLLVPTLQALPWEFRVYGMGRSGVEGNVTLKAFDEKGFVEDLRTARCLVSGGGYSLMGEAVHLHVPVLSVPVERQFEQELNARYLQALGYGEYAERLDAETIAAFVERSEEHAAALRAGYLRPQDNAMLFECLDELVALVEAGVRRPRRLASPSMGSWEPDVAKGGAGADGAAGDDGDADDDAGDEWDQYV